ncbi:MAG TPA: RlmE family RNA methyltransferase, partial [Rectinemataceae bacterium]|nr:RlmE family RNA methyltransferase [Rectinemataceae bacterium]
MAGYDKPDFWALKARKEGYPARSVYKLEEIAAKFGLLKKGSGRSPSSGGSPGPAGKAAPGVAPSQAPCPTILDIGAAPGSWSLWLLRALGGRGRLVAVDIQDLGISPEAANFTFIKGSIFDEAIRTRLREAGPYTLVVSDAAPSTTGNRLVDQARSEDLVEAVMGLGLEVLAPGGSLVMKIFQSGEEKRLITELKKRFDQARGFKPEA